MKNDVQGASQIGNVALFHYSNSYKRSNPLSSEKYSARMKDSDMTQFLSPLIYAAVALVPMLCMYSKKELTLKQHIVKQILQLFALEAVLIFFGLGSKSPFARKCRPDSSVCAFRACDIYSCRCHNMAS